MSESIRISGKKHPFKGEKAQGDWVRRPGGWLILEKPDGTRERMMLLESRGQLSASIGGRLCSGQIVSDRASGAAAGGGGDTDLVAQFPGKVRKVLVSAGDRVEEGQTLLQVEAMKMEFTIKAPFPGSVELILVTEGQQLSPGDRLVDIKQAVEDSSS